MHHFFGIVKSKPMIGIQLSYISYLNIYIHHFYLSACYLSCNYIHIPALLLH